MNASELKSAAANVTARANALGFTKDGRPMVIDQAYELVAAAHGKRNQHVLRATLDKASAPAPALTASDILAANRRFQDLLDSQGWNDSTVSSMMKDFLQDQSQWPAFVAYCEKRVTPEDQFEEVIRRLEKPLLQLGYVVECTDGVWTWSDSFEEMSEDFPSEHEAYQALIDFVCKGADLDPDSLCALDAAGQDKRILEVAVVTRHLRSIQALQKRWGSEHGYYTQEVWLNDTKKGATKPGYWDWVAYTIRSNGGEEEHCECGAPLNDGEGYDGKCGSCADAQANRTPSP